MKRFWLQRSVGEVGDVGNKLLLVCYLLCEGRMDVVRMEIAKYKAKGVRKRSICLIKMRSHYRSMGYGLQCIKT